ncbi:TetR/AcrR family transcriptional regulator [Primorskyibacter sp. S87]|uniref:TetR/AcrR family transcriptional regulator n=1 Tax=Primorskyibacter sp. S87 TaxID=3415126 RepID=UPI003C7D3020
MNQDINEPAEAGPANLSNDPKQETILLSAWTAFSTYGFRKTSMDDIARGAGMSRPALYLHYRNKEDIFRSLVQYYYDEGTVRLAEALKAEGTPQDVFAAAFHAQGGATVEAMLTSPHGMELLDTGATISGDLNVAGEARFVQIYADWLSKQAAQGQVKLSGPADEISATITSALKGIKTTAANYDEYRTRVDQLAQLVGAGLLPR